MSARFLLEQFPEEITSDDDTVLLPILSIEQHGPHLLLGCDGYGALALVQELSALTGALALPPIPYCWEGCTNAFAGGIGVREGVFLQYLRSVVVGLWRDGFRHIIIVNTHGGNFYALHNLPQQLLAEDGIPLLTFYGMGPAREAHEEMEQAGGEAGSLVGSLRLLGREDLVAKVEETNRQALAEFGGSVQVHLDPPAALSSQRLGNVGHDYSHECQHVQPNDRLDPARAAAAKQKAVPHLAETVQAYREYVAHLIAEGTVTPGESRR